MKNNRDCQAGEFFFRFYKKHTASFLANVYMAGITGTSKDIHRARLDVKKILAILDLLRIVRNKNEKNPAYERIFKNLYQASGRIREIQVNQLLLTRPEFETFDLSPYSSNLLQQEKGRTREFLHAIRKFNKKRLSKADDKIKNEAFKITPRTLQNKVNRYIRTKTDKFINLLEKGCDEKDLHKVRQHLKEFSTVLSLVISFKYSRKLEMVIESLNKTEMMIGDWHDKVVLADSMKGFLDNAGSSPEILPDPVRECYNRLIEDNRNLIESLNHDVKTVITRGFPMVDPDD